MGVEAVVVGQLVDREAEQSLYRDHAAKAGQRPAPRPPAASHRNPETAAVVPAAARIAPPATAIQPATTSTNALS